MQKPNFFIIGVSKCGTTSLSQHLRNHKDIFFSDPKEPRFFSPDFPEESRRIGTLGEYEELFADADGYSAVGEGSAYYAFSKVAILKILEYSPDARFIFMVRNPIDLVISWHAQLVREDREDITDLESAWRAQENGRRLARSKLPVSLTYREIGMLGSCLESVLQNIQKEKLLVIFLDDLKENPRSVYKDTLAFLGVLDDGRTEFSVSNKNKKARIPILRKLILASGRFRRKYGLVLHTGLGQKVTKKVMSLIMKDEKQKPLNQEFRKELIKYFRKDIEKLTRLTGRDLSSWLK